MKYPAVFEINVCQITTALSVIVFMQN